ncbi:MAG: hypothetical protein HY901_19415 [Deltaproteobacteria bacterium]|nr:hypothetical protein [Deltaproteobacteria bacterium]
MSRPVIIAAAALALSLVSCRRAGAPDAGEPAAPPKIFLSKDRTDLLFTYVDEEGRLQDVDSADQVPEVRRKSVLVRDLSKNADELKADQYVFVADLTREEDGAWPCTAVSRYAIDRSIRAGDFAATDDADDGGQRIVLYGTSWCGACSQARQWFKARGLPFADKDIEKDPRAAAEMQRKMKRAGLPMGGVPVIDVMGELILGFDERRIAALVKGT